MSVDNERVAIALRALRASGSEREADLVKAILGDPAAAPAQTVEAPAPAQPAAAAAEPAEQTPPVPTLDELEALGRDTLAAMDPKIIDEALRRGV